MPSDSAASAATLPPPDGLMEEAPASNDPTDNIRRVLASRETVASLARMAKDHPNAQRAILDHYEQSGVAPELIDEYRSAIERQVQVYTELERVAFRGRLRYKFARASTVRGLPPVEWLVDGVLMSDSLVVLAGKEASGKSFVALSLALAIAAHHPWLGRNVLGGSVAYVVAEGYGSRFNARIEAWEQHTSVNDPSLYLLGEAPQLLDDASTDALIAAAKEIADLRLIVIDTLARTFVGGEENSAKDVGVLIANAERLRRATGATVLLIHHETKAGGTPRGSSALTGAASTMLSLRRESEHDLILACDKQKDAEEFKPIRLHLVDVALTSGDRSLVVTDAPQLGAASMLALPRAQQDALDVLSQQFPNGAESEVWRKGCGVKRGGSWNRVVGALVSGGHIEHRGTGRGSTYHAAPVRPTISIPPPPMIQVDPDCSVDQVEQSP